VSDANAVTESVSDFHLPITPGAETNGDGLGVIALPAPSEIGAGAGATLSASPRHRRRLQQGRIRLLATGDLLALAVAIAIADFVTDAVAPPAISASLPQAIGFFTVAAFVWLGVLACYRLYERDTKTLSPASFDEIGPLFHALVVGTLVLLIGDQALARIEGVHVFTAGEATVFVCVAVLVVPSVRGAHDVRKQPAPQRP